MYEIIGELINIIDLPSTLEQRLMNMEVALYTGCRDW